MPSLPLVARESPAGFAEELWDEAGWLPCVLSVDLSLRQFTVRDLLRLETGDILESKNANGADVPVIVNTKLVGWAEFEVVGQRLAVRMTELA
jgi:flagellar motor switch/type III secretory pathway protein FliN